jgi:hypothetical protein
MYLLDGNAVHRRQQVQGGEPPREELRETADVLRHAPQSRDLKKFKPGMRLLIEGDLEKYKDTDSGTPDEVTIVRAHVTEAKEPDGAYRVSEVHPQYYAKK